MKKLFTFTIISNVLIAIIIVFLLFRIKDNVKSIYSDAEKKKQKIGEKVIINKDTLLIVDYSIWDQNYILSDGSEVSPILIRKSESSILHNPN